MQMTNMMLGEVVFGGVGSGMYGMVLFIIVAVFIAGLMVGRTPEYLGRKIESRQIKLVMTAILLPNITILAGAALSLLFEPARQAITAVGPHSISQVVYAFASAAGNNGSAFAGLNSNSVYYNVALGISMIVGRFGVIVPILAFAGSIASKTAVPESAGTFPTDSILFCVLLTLIVVVVGALTFFPALSLGPLTEQFLYMLGRTF
jgi:K+-transporting ATPase ATPase A chain